MAHITLEKIFTNYILNNVRGNEYQFILVPTRVVNIRLNHMKLLFM